MRTQRWYWLAPILFGMLLHGTPAASAVFIGAHPDDIAFFMSKNVWTSLAQGEPTIFILTTAGDAGNGSGGGGIIPYYRARLNGHESVIRFWKSMDGKWVEPTVRGSERFDQFEIEKFSFGNVVLYNLNLPDGNGDGAGFISTGSTSMAQLLSGRVASMTSIDTVNTYSAAQLRELLRQIISRNMRDVAEVWVHYQDPFRLINPGDHSDHVATGQLVNQALAEKLEFACVHSARYLGYVTGGMARNLTIAETEVHIAGIGALNAGVVGSGTWSNWDDTHRRWLGRQYLSIQQGGNCYF